MCDITNNSPENVYGSAKYFCSVGHFLPKIQCSQCKECPAGKHSDDTPSNGTDICLGSYQPPPVACVLCEPGNFSAVAAQTHCRRCPAGKYQELSGKPSCKDCPPGKFDHVTAGASTESSSGAQLCYQCRAGQYQSSSSQTSCQRCPAGKYQVLSGKHSCKECPAGKFDGGAPTESSAGAQSCSLCPLGQYQSSSSQASCVNCPFGKFGSKEGLHSSACSGDCPRGTACPGGCSSATVLIPGMVYNNSALKGNISCELKPSNCSRGFFCIDGDQQPCPVGKYQLNTGQPYCNTKVPCAPGKFERGNTSARDSRCQDLSGKS